MSEWKETKIGKVAKLQGGFAFSSTSFRERGIPLIRISTITSTCIDFSDCVFLDDKFSQTFPDFLAREDDVVIAMSGATTGKNTLVKSCYLPSFINQRVGRFKIIDYKSLDSKFLYFYINTDGFQNQILIDAIGGAQPNISSKQVENIIIKLPPLPVQRKIARILSTIDGQIEKTEAIIAKYQAIKQGMLQDLFTRGIDVRTGQLRPRYEDAPALYKASPLGMIPTEWEVKQLREVSSLITKGESPIWQGFSYQEEGVTFITSENVRNGEVDIQYSLKYIPVTFHSKLGRSQLKSGDILINLVGASVGRSGIFNNSVEANINQAVATVRTNINQAQPRWIVSYLQQADTLDKLLGSQVETARANLSLKNIREFNIPVPNDKEQTSAILRIKSSINLIEDESKTLSKLQLLKQGLMQDLLSGKVEVNA